MGSTATYEDLAVAVRNRVRRIADYPGLRAALEAEALDEAQRLGTFVDPEVDLDLALRRVDACRALGWFHWYRHLALCHGVDQGDLDKAVRLLTFCFVAGQVDLPTDLLPRIMLQPEAVFAIDCMTTSGAPALQTRVITAMRDTLRATADDHPTRSVYLRFLAEALLERFRTEGRRSDLDTAVRSFGAALHAAIDGTDDAVLLLGLAAALLERHALTGAGSDLDGAVDCLRSACAAAPPEDPLGTEAATGLVAVLLRRFRNTLRRADLDAAAKTLDDMTLRDAGDSDPVRTPRLLELGTAFATLFEDTRSLEDLDRGADFLDRFVRATPDDNSDRAVCLGMLALMSRDRYHVTREPADLDRWIEKARTAVRTVEGGSADHATFVGELGVAHQLRFDLKGLPDDLDKAVRYTRAAVDLTPDVGADRAGHLTNLAATLHTRFTHQGLPKDLDRAIDCLREALVSAPREGDERAAALSNLSGALLDRFHQFKVGEDVDEAVTVGRAAVDNAPDGHPHRAAAQANLAMVLTTRFDVSRRRDDLDQAVRLSSASASGFAPGHPDRPASLCDWGTALGVRFRHFGDPSDLDEAIECFRRAIESTGGDVNRCAAAWSNLGIALRSRAERTSDTADLDEAIGLFRTAEQSVRATDHQRVLFQTNRAGTLMQKYERTNDPADRQQAVVALTEAAKAPSGSPSMRIAAATRAAALLADSSAGSAADMAVMAVELLPQVAPRQLARGDRQRALGSLSGLASFAASLVLADSRAPEATRARRALQLLEMGRAVLLSQALDIRGDLTRLRRRDRALADRFVRLRSHLDLPPGPSPEPAPSPTTHPGQPRGAGEHHRPRLAHALADTLDEIRRLDGFESFAMAPAVEELLAQARQGPVVVFNIGEHGGHALMVTSEGVDTLPLPELTADTTVRKAAEFRIAVQSITHGTDGGLPTDPHGTMRAVLDWLWTAAAGPVLDALGLHCRPAGSADWPRVWWVPGGLLGLLPLHAAGQYSARSGHAHRCTVLDRVVSSYTPTVRALAHARRRTPDRSASGRALVVAMPTTPGLPADGRLDHVDGEVAVLRRHLPEVMLLREPDGTPPGGLGATRPATPTKAAVLDRLPDCSIAHFACHGESDTVDPAHSRLVLHDHHSDPFTVASLDAVHLDRAELAYLSACHTAANDADHLLDEAIHLTSAFQLAGFRHVVGTLWPINDRIATLVADTFYTHLRTGTGTLNTSRSALALHLAMRAIRDGDDLSARTDRAARPYLWAAYLHAGA
ncbi:CHAT domain-containing tetratricopeptide repeat protein [Streptomyces sp. Amel2xC10]|uniref:CHAT domain-containing tetratricopeptide repeat protein n=1 Tax=Streptomyces sp. Amel2xC10 TaxID=1305826 RepID=UPI000A08223B|nr:CHAT domain-containing protein [Streptomyces sp. Amel2xC10]SMF84783.1 Sel1 repeat-containing protein [Streptomyces sp. Amel2xC10]